MIILVVSFVKLKYNASVLGYNSFISQEHIPFKLMRDTVMMAKVEAKEMVQ